MSKKSKKSRQATVESFEKKAHQAVGPFTVVVEVFGEKIDFKTKAPASPAHVNPEARCTMTLHDDRLAVDGGSVQGALSKMRTFSQDSKGKKIFDPLPFYRIVSVTDHGKQGVTVQEVPVSEVREVEDVEDEEAPVEFVLDSSTSVVESAHV